jgi:hypothetical protein
VGCVEKQEEEIPRYVSLDLEEWNNPNGSGWPVARAYSVTEFIRISHFIFNRRESNC